MAAVLNTDPERGDAQLKMPDSIGRNRWQPNSAGTAVDGTSEISGFSRAGQKKTGPYLEDLERDDAQLKMSDSIGRNRWRPNSAGTAVDGTSEISGFSRASQKKTGPYLEGNLKLTDTIECSAEVMCCRFSQDGTHLAIGLCDGIIKICNASNCQQLYSLQDQDIKESRLPVTQIRFRPFTPGEKTEYSHIIIATYASGHVKFWHYTSGKCLQTINEVRQTLALSMKPEGTAILTAGSDAKIHLYDIETKQLLNTMEASDGKEIMDGHRFRIFALQYNKNHPNVFISGGWDDTVQYWDDRKTHSVKKITGPHICGDSLDIDPVHNHILTGSWRNTNVLQIWDFAMAVKIKDVPQDTLNHSRLYCAQWLGKDSIICGGNDQNMARTIDRGTLNTTGQLVDLPQGVYCIDNDKSGPYPKVAIGAEKKIYMLKTNKKN